MYFDNEAVYMAALSFLFFDGSRYIYPIRRYRPDKSLSTAAGDEHTNARFFGVQPYKIFVLDLCDIYVP
jgi:hypothetical protein